MHEACYADGEATRWAAERVMPDEFREDPTLFTGEHVFPWTFEDDAELAPLARGGRPARAARVAARCTTRRCCAPATCRAPAAIYAEDPYVTARSPRRPPRWCRGCAPWITNEYEHNGLRADGAADARPAVRAGPGPAA